MDIIWDGITQARTLTEEAAAARQALADAAKAGDWHRVLIGSGAWRTHQNAHGERPVDVAARRGHRHLLETLAPVHRHPVPLGMLLRAQAHFHTVIRGRAERLVEEHGLRLPELEPLLELDPAEMWFAVPGMYGGSGQRHEITPGGSQLVDEGFV